MFLHDLVKVVGLEIEKGLEKINTSLQIGVFLILDGVVVLNEIVDLAKRER
jgi:hypothetical protein